MSTCPRSPGNSALVEHVAEIRRLGRRVVADIVEVGRRLGECKKIVGYGNWLPWLEREFGWSNDTAERFIRVASLSQQIPQIAEYELPVSALYLLAAPSTPDTAREEILGRAKNGESISLAQTKQVIEESKGRKQPAREAGLATNRTALLLAAQETELEKQVTALKERAAKQKEERAARRKSPIKKLNPITSAWLHATQKQRREFSLQYRTEIMRAQQAGGADPAELKRIKRAADRAEARSQATADMPDIPDFLQRPAP